MTEAAFGAPASIRALLDRLGLPLREVADSPALNPAQCLQTVILEDAAGSLLVLFGRDRLLDLRRLSTLTGRTLAATGAGRLRRLLDKHGLGCMPGLPVLSSGACLYDEPLLQQPELLVPSGQPGVLLQISREAFTHLLGKARPAALATALDDPQRDPERPDADHAQILRAVQALTGQPIQQRLEVALDILPLPESAQTIIKLRMDPDTTVDDITRVVERDPLLAAQLVRWAGAGCFGLAGKIRSVEDALVLALGFERGINLALGLAPGRALRLPPGQPEANASHLQRMACTAAMNDALSLAMPASQRPERGLSYLCGLLQDVGYLALAHVFPQQLGLLCRQIEANPHLHHNRIEQQLLGIHRDQLGSWLMRSWDMPEELHTALRFQNDPSYAGPHAQYANLLCLGNRLLAERGVGRALSVSLPLALFERLSIDPQQAAGVADSVMRDAPALQAMGVRLQQPG